MRKANRQILLLLDNAPVPVHKVNHDNKLTNITIRFFAPNMTSVTQPCDAGIIANYKAQYRKLFIQQRINFLDTTFENDTDNVLEYNIKHAIYNIAEAWMNVTPNTIVNCWRKTGVLPPSITNIEEANQKLQAEYQKECLTIQQLINGLNLADSLSANGK